MKISLERAALLQTLGHLQSVVERRNTLPILSNVMISAEDGSLTFTVTDLDLQATEVIPAEVISPGKTTISAHMLFDIVRKLPDGSQISMTLDNGRMTIAAGRSRFTLPVLAPDEFPVIVPGDLPNEFTLSAEDLGGILGRSRFAVSTEETRYYLNGIYIHTVDDTLFAAATDGHRLARIKIKRPEGAGDIDGAIIPRKAVGEILKVIDDFETDVKIALSSSKMRIEMGNLVFVSKLVDGTYPDYARVIPSGNDKVFKIAAQDLERAIDRVSTVATEKTRAVKVSLDKNILQLTVNSVDMGVANEELAIDYTGDGVEIGFNAGYLRDILKQCSNSDVEVAIGDPTSPVLIRPQNDTDDWFILMPMRV
ncbi:DNA polymerase III subunit beta [Erythrobacter aureus]|uniref:Beta sliding clamp n=1 Tax=Erythrobacter aureus TaxID=2182384 RepID=A0A345YJI3_9SPHN|nr:DNA polymerase III subunit beta [Erythrobacter aureus]AXK44085.1 DNA polymerase III subunit beta [Erythrobacter aureus]